MPWRILTYRLPPEPSRHRVAAWRELRKVGAVSLQAGTWALPEGDVFDHGLQRAVEIAERAGGRATVIAVGPADPSIASLEEAFTAEREDEWAEFLSECDKFDTEIAKEIRTHKFTLAELDEEEHNLERLRRWYRDLRVKDLFGAPSAPEAGRRLKECSECLEDFAERVYEARGRP
jgi:sugar phosphate isomerase/epimerase